jgi:DnaJ-class molecular chaperone
MYNKNPYIILGLSNNASYSQIKKAYKNIALKNHPDKLYNLSKDIQDNHLNIFRDATDAYNFLINHNDINNSFNYFNNNDFNYNNDHNDNNDDLSFNNLWNNVFYNNDDIKTYLKNLAINFLNNNYKKYNNNNNNNNKSISPIQHNITLNVSYSELYLNSKKKLRLILKGIDEPIFIDIYCNDSYPFINKIYLDDFNNEHNIYIKLNLQYNNIFSHITYKNNNNIDIIYNLDLNIFHYFNGFNTKILYIDNNIIDIFIPPFNKKIFKISDKGINGGDLILKLNYLDYNIDIDKWNNINNEHKDIFINILDKVFLI